MANKMSATNFPELEEWKKQVPTNGDFKDLRRYCFATIDRAAELIDALRYIDTQSAGSKVAAFKSDLPDTSEIKEYEAYLKWATVVFNHTLAKLPIDAEFGSGFSVQQQFVNKADVSFLDARIDQNGELARIRRDFRMGVCSLMLQAAQECTKRNSPEAIETAALYASEAIEFTREALIVERRYRSAQALDLLDFEPITAALKLEHMRLVANDIIFSVSPKLEPAKAIPLLSLAVQNTGSFAEHKEQSCLVYAEPDLRNLLRALDLVGAINMPDNEGLNKTRQELGDIMTGIFGGLERPADDDPKLKEPAVFILSKPTA
jgi:hypothetical protein